jgi:hypothetical protein
MSEELLETEATTSNEQTQTTQDAEPEKTTQTNEPVDSNEAANDESDTTETLTPEQKELESLRKSNRDTKAALTKLQQERAENIKKAEYQQLEQNKIKVSEEEKQANLIYNKKLDQLKQGKSQLIAQETKKLDYLGYTSEQKSDLIAQLNYQLDSEYDSLKAQYESEKNASINNIQQQHKTNYELQVKQNYEKPEESIKDKLNKPEIKLIFDKVKEKGYPNPQDIIDNLLPIFEEAFEVAKIENAKIKQLNASKDATKQSQKGINGSTPSTSSNKGGTKVPTTRADLKKWLQSQ